jgi:hypothetical protein
MTLTRKEFLSSVVGVAAGAAGAALLVACSDSGSASADAASAGNCAANGAAPPTIAGNHGHVLTVSKADIAAGVAKTYDITGTADHTHHVTISAPNFGTLTSNMTVSTTSTTDASHSHTITIMCA